MGADQGDPEETLFPDARDGDQQARLRTIIGRGERGRWRRVLGPGPGVLDGLQALAARAPHMHELSDLVSMHVQAAINARLPLVLPFLDGTQIRVVGPR